MEMMMALDPLLAVITVFTLLSGPCQVEMETKFCLLFTIRELNVCYPLVKELSL